MTFVLVDIYPLVTGHRQALTIRRSAHFYIAMMTSWLEESVHA